ncbi:Hypothetical protein, putative [Bodo saltans]|nr:Hypothetical protein, putative [Bodo saltans]|eukprot:CUG78385.1 Hypothetical protein, putative [Bodo saltans]
MRCGLQCKYKHSHDREPASERGCSVRQQCAHVYSNWTVVNACAKACDVIVSTRTIVSQPRNGGVACDNNALTMEQACNVTGCNCSTFANSTSCASNGCRWVLGSPSMIYITNPCLSLANASSCAFGSGCVWNSSNSICSSDPCYAGACADTCDAQYGSSSTACMLDPNCMFNISSGLCTSSCVKFGTANTCLKYFCVWSGTFCQSSCSALYSGSMSSYCASNPSCQVAADGTCMQKCSMLKTTACSGDFCRLSNGTCQTTCAGKYSNSAPCMNDGGCIWDPVSSMCRASCSGLTPCPQSYCDMSTVTSLCLNRCEYMYSVERGCMSDNNCMWYNNSCRLSCSHFTSLSCARPCVPSPTSCYCVPPCDLRYATVSTCHGDAGCQWDYYSRSCGMRNCTSTTAESCLLGIGNCQWIASTCYSPCSATPQQSACDATTVCNWDSSLTSCVSSCQYRLPTTCTSSICDLVSGVCQSSCSSQRSATPCSAITACEWTSSATCRLQCQYATVASCNADPRCVYSNGQCRAAICTAASSVTCLSDSQCIWNTTTKSCSVTFCGFATAATCATGYNCRWVLGSPSSSCLPNPCPAAFLPATCATLGSGCTWNTTSATCYYNRCYASTANVCNTDTTCSWNSTANTCGNAATNCVYSCWTTPTTCTMTCNGGTNTSTRTIVKQATNGGIACNATTLTLVQVCNAVACDCASIRDQVECTRVACVYVNRRCTSLAGGSCVTKLTQATCLASGTCMWIGATCIASGSGGSSRGATILSTTGASVGETTTSNWWMLGASSFRTLPRIDVRVAHGATLTVWTTTELLGGGASVVSIRSTLSWAPSSNITISKGATVAVEGAASTVLSICAPILGGFTILVGAVNNSTVVEQHQLSSNASSTLSLSLRGGGTVLLLSTPAASELITSLSTREVLSSIAYPLQTLCMVQVTLISMNVVVTETSSLLRVTGTELDAKTTSRSASSLGAGEAQQLTMHGVGVILAEASVTMGNGSSLIVLDKGVDAQPSLRFIKYPSNSETTIEKKYGLSS